jgi:molecular chaperone GrpE
MNTGNNKIKEPIAEELRDVGTPKVQSIDEELSVGGVDTANLSASAGEVEGEVNESSVEKTEAASVDWESRYVEKNDAYLRLMAEFDNYRKRTLREKSDLIKTGGEAALISLLPVIDDFERALDTIRQTEDVTSVSQGVELIYTKFMSYLAGQGVKPIEAVGIPFDTERCEAIATIPAPDEVQKGKILDCIQTGYMLYDKVIRHAKVVVGE